MIFDTIQNKDNYKADTEIYQALCFLAHSRNFKELEPETVVQKGYSFANPVSFVTKEESKCFFEAHKNNIDVHYIVKGTERIAVAAVHELQAVSAFDIEKDICFYEGPESGNCLLHPGTFLICFPGEAHKVALMDKKPEPVQKIVVKIRAGRGR